MGSTSKSDQIISLTFLNLVSPKVGAKHELFSKNKGGFVEHLSLTYVAQTNCDQIISLTFLNLVLPKAGAKNELLFNKLRWVS
jgi:hypothetical protein